MRASDPRATFLAAAERGGIVPVVREVVPDADTPVAALVKIARPPFAFLLESLVGGERWARYTFLGTEPREAWRYRGSSVERWTPADGWRPDRFLSYAEWIRAGGRPDADCVDRELSGSRRFRDDPEGAPSLHERDRANRSSGLNRKFGGVAESG